MTLSNYFFEKPFEISENFINVLVIENPVLLRNIMNGLIIQQNGKEGDFYLFDGNSSLDFKQNVQIITDVFSLDFCSSKLLTAVNKSAATEAEQLSSLTVEIKNKLNELGFGITQNLDFQAGFHENPDISSIIKLLGFYVDVEGAGIPEKLIEYLKLCRSFFSKKLFIIFNIKSFFTENELEMFYRTLMYEKLNIFLIEPCHKTEIKNYEKLCIIDSDLCEI